MLSHLTVPLKCCCGNTDLPSLISRLIEWFCFQIFIMGHTYYRCYGIWTGSSDSHGLTSLPGSKAGKLWGWNELISLAPWPSTFWDTEKTHKEFIPLEDSKGLLKTISPIKAHIKRKSHCLTSFELSIQF